jgi:hypothetical protein
VRGQRLRRALWSVSAHFALCILPFAFMIAGQGDHV